MTQDFTILHLFSGIGGAALGFQQAEETWRGLRGRFHTLAGIDVDPEACEDFRTLTGAPAVQMDLFSREDYRAYHGQEPPPGWREATPADIRRATGGECPDVVFLSPPCKSFSALLPRRRAEEAKYQALSRLVTRGLFLTLEAFADDLPGVILLENVPRITTRGAGLLSEVKRLLQAYGYVFSEGYHDCGELGGLAQHRRRYLLIARHPEKVPCFVYQPPKYRVRAIGEVLEKLPLPDDPRGGPMHRLPRLQWRMWVRLALIPAGGDWRALEELVEKGWYHGAYRIIPWDMPSGTVTSGDGPSCHAPSVADPRLGHLPRSGVFRVVRWDEPATTIVGHARVGGSNGVAAVADPRLLPAEGRYGNKYRVQAWDKPAYTVTGTADIQAGAPSIADPRLPPRDSRHPGVYRVCRWEEPGPCVTGTRFGSGAPAVADPRLGCKPRNGSYKVQHWGKPSATIIGAGDIHSGAAAVADPRIPADNERPDPPPVIIALDGTWHRPLTTLELAALQGFPLVMPDGRPFALAGKSDARWRERIGNAVPPPAARAIGKVILPALMAGREGVWVLGATPIWVQPEVLPGCLNT